MTATNLSALDHGFTERDLALEWGLAVDDLASERKKNLQSPQDWELKKNRVTYTPAGRARLMTALKIAESGPPSPAANGTNGSELHPGDVRELVCLGCRWSNFRIVPATFGARTQLVRVRDNKNFVPGMVMKCRYAHDDLWDLDQRLPRWRGKW